MQFVCQTANRPHPPSYALLNSDHEAKERIYNRPGATNGHVCNFLLLVAGMFASVHRKFQTSHTLQRHLNALSPAVFMLSRVHQDSVLKLLNGHVVNKAMLTSPTPKKNKTVSIVVPMCNEEESIEILRSKLSLLQERLAARFRGRILPGRRWKYGFNMGVDALRGS